MLTPDRRIHGSRDSGNRFYGGRLGGARLAAHAERIGIAEQASSRRSSNSRSVDGRRLALQDPKTPRGRGEADPRLVHSPPGIAATGQLFLINGLAFGLVEVAAAAAPRDAEPWPVLALAIGAMGGVAAILGVLYGLALRLLPIGLRRGPIIRTLLAPGVVAFAPGAALLLPKLRIALGGATVAAVCLLLSIGALLAALAWLGRPGGEDRETREPRGGEARRRSRPAFASHGLIALGVWSVAIRAKDLSTLVETRSSIVVLPTSAWLVVAAAGTLLALAAAADRRAEAAGRRWILAAASALFLAVVAWRLLAPPHFDPGFEPAAERLGRGTPVILIVLDTVRADHLSLYGYARDTSPQLERFARDAVVFERALSVSSWTLPAHASLFTGLLPLTHGALRLPGLDEDRDSLAEKRIHRPAYPLGERYRTLAEWFLDHGYRTGALVANYAYLDPAFRIDQGFETYFAVRNVPVEPRLLRVADRRLTRLPGMARHWQVYRSAAQINALAHRFLDAQESHRFFLFLNYMEAHLPWGPHQPGLRYEKYAAEPSLPPPAGSDRAPEEERWRRRIDLYDSNLASLDQRLGELFDLLRRMELYDRSLIVVTSDHGESFGENGFDGHGMSLNEAEVWVPLVIKYPLLRWFWRKSGGLMAWWTCFHTLGRTASGKVKRISHPKS
ncbi:MAG: sulfatase [Holophagales bacterium]|nr:sulfatase [Holophagales bacterium]